MLLQGKDKSEELLSKLKEIIDNLRTLLYYKQQGLSEKDLKNI